MTLKTIYALDFRLIAHHFKSGTTLEISGL